MKKLVLLHGALGAGSQLQPLAKALSGAYDVQVYEFPGHGARAAEPAEFTMEFLVADFHNWLVAHAAEPVDVFGFSMGGYAALVLAGIQPHLFNRIVTLGTKFNWTFSEAEKETAKLDAGILAQKAPQYVEYLQQLHDMHWQKLLEGTRGLMMGLGQNPLLNDVVFKTIQTPVTLMLGELDKMVTRDETVQAKNAMPNGEFRLVDGFVHPLERLDTAKLAEVVVRGLGD